MYDLEMYISLAATVIGLIASTTTFLIKFIKSTKARNVAEQVLKMTQLILPFIEEAEKFAHFSGEEKKQYVMTRSMQLAVKNNMKVNDDFISNKIEELINLTNHVNTNKANVELKKILTGRT